MIPTGTGFNTQQEEMLRIDSSSRFVAVDLSAADFTCTYNTIAGPCRAIMVGGAGNLVLKNSLGISITFTGVLAGALYPLSTNTIVKLGTTATNIVAIF